jgi:hypothetical protein
MSKSQRVKGKAGELEVAALAREQGHPDAGRNGDARQIDGDLTGVDGAYVEVRRRNALRVDAWAREVEAEAKALGTDDLPVVAFRRDREPWRAVVPLDRLLGLLSEVRYLRERC